MITISTRKQLSGMVDKNRDLTVDDDVLIEFAVTREDVRDVKCRNLTLRKNEGFLDFTGNFNGRDFTGGDFTGWNFTGRNFTGRDFNGRNFTGRNFNGRNFTGGDFNGRNFSGGDFTGGDFNGWNFNGWDFNGLNFTGGDFNGLNFSGGDFTGGDISYNAFFCCYGKILKHGKIEGRYPKAHPPIELEATARK